MILKEFECTYYNVCQIPRNVHDELSQCAKKKLIHSGNVNNLKEVSQATESAVNGWEVTVHNEDCSLSDNHCH